MNIEEVLRDQDGVIARRQVIASGESDDDIERRIRRREWARVHPGVYVHHTGPMAWRQRAWAAVLLYAPAALASGSALRAAGLARHGSERDPVEIAVAADRRVQACEGTTVSRLTDFRALAMVNMSPPRVVTEHAVLVLASSACGDDTAVAVISDACQSRHTSPGRLLDQLQGMQRLPRRRLLLTLLDDVASGAYSALEHRYLTQVERSHGLPSGSRQRRVRPGRSLAYRDVDYLGLRTVVELDGRLGHEEARDKWADRDRDIDSLVAGDLTLRAGWGQVMQPCRLASAVAAVLVSRGWTGRARGCSADCPADTGGSPAPGAGDPPLSFS